MTARKSHETETEATDTVGDATGTVPETAGPDLANVAIADAPTGTIVDGDLNDVDADDLDPNDAFAALKALGNANPDVNVTAVQNGHGLWTWTARDAEDGRKLAAGGPHHAQRLVENLTKLFSGSTVALHATGLAKTKRLA